MFQRLYYWWLNLINRPTVYAKSNDDHHKQIYKASMIDIDEIGRKTQSWFYYVPDNTIITQLIVPPGCLDKFEIYITMRGQYDYSYQEPKCWDQYQLTRKGEHKFSQEDVLKILHYMKGKFYSHHAD